MQLLLKQLGIDAEGTIGTSKRIIILSVNQLILLNIILLEVYKISFAP